MFPASELFKNNLIPQDLYYCTSMELKTLSGAHLRSSHSGWRLDSDKAACLYSNDFIRSGSFLSLNNIFAEEYDGEFGRGYMLYKDDKPMIAITF